MRLIEDEINYIKSFPHKDISHYINDRLDNCIRSYQSILLRAVSNLTVKEKTKLLKGVLDEYAE